MDDVQLYRRGVGVMLINADRKVWVGARVDNPDDAWQMPQGGIDEGEDPWNCALRELEEETGIAARLVELIAECSEPLNYDLPEEWRPRLWAGKFKGQRQNWYLARFLGEDEDVRIDAHSSPEFRDWKWVDPAELPDLIVPFKRDLYARLIEDFRTHLND